MVRHFKKRAESRLVDTALPKKSGKYADGKGLWLYVTPRGSRSWVYRYKPNLREPDKAEGFMGLGSYPAVSLAAARDRAQQAREDIGRGEDPVTANERRAAEAAVVTEGASILRRSFKAYAAAYITGKGKAWKNDKHAEQWSTSLETYAYPLIGAVAIGDLRMHHVLGVLKQPIEDEGGAEFWSARTETASRVRGRIATVFDYAKSIALGKEISLGDNPASWPVLKFQLPAPSAVKHIEHFAALHYRDMPAFMAQLREQTGTTSLALEFLILTASRTDEVLGARWSEIDLTARVWTIPKERSKSRSRSGAKDQRKPLSEAALAILEAVKDLDKDRVFPRDEGKGGLSPNALIRLRDRMKRQDVTPHGMRSTFKDYAMEQTNFPHHASELALGHTVGDEVERAYRRGDMLEIRFKLADAWAQHCLTPPSGNVVPFKDAARTAAAAS
jgi:integrase